jgi:NADPH:quinone reductase-like Zn-dependent oxidoreductase
MANRAVVVDPAATGRLTIRDVEAPVPRSDEAIVRVQAISLNRGEVRMSQRAEAGWRPGWDMAGVVEQAAADGSGPQAGARVVGLLRSGAWAERVVAPANRLAALPDGVAFAQAATLPVAGLTAYHALRKGGLLLARPVLITGATGGCGDFALRLAKLSGARVVAHVRRAGQEAEVRAAGADAVVVGDLTQSTPFGPYWLIVESVGGATLSQALRSLDEGGTIVTLGTSAGQEVTFDAQKFYNTGTTTLYGFILSDEFTSLETAADGLARLAALVAEGKLTPRIGLETGWAEVGEVAQKLLDRAYPGKAVLHLA